MRSVVAARHGSRDEKEGKRGRCSCIMGYSTVWSSLLARVVVISCCTLAACRESNLVWSHDCGCRVETYSSMSMYGCLFLVGNSYLRMSAVNIGWVEGLESSHFSAAVSVSRPVSTRFSESSSVIKLSLSFCLCYLHAGILFCVTA